MSFSKNLTITVRNTDAQLNEPLYVYEKDRNLIVYFKIMDYKYKFDKNPTNVLASVDDIMEAYATIVDPNGYELTRQYGEVIEDEIKFIVTNDLVDELDELGTYRLQFHIKCQHSEFTIPEISFKVLERLKGFRTITDEGEVGDEILNNSESFIDEEGKLHLVWREGDTISSVRLNQMVQVINNAVDEEHQRQINEVNRENRANAKLNELETRFSALTTSQQQSAEVIDARDGETSLKARLDRDVKKHLEYNEQISNLNKELDKVKKLEESTVSTVETESDFTTVEATSNGYFEDVKLEGKTLVNLPRRQVSYYPSGSNDAMIVSDSNVTCYEYEIKPNTTYTIKKDEVSDRGTVALFSSNSVGSVATKTLISMISDGKISTIRTGNEDKYMLLYVNSTLISSGVKTTVLEGDYTQNPPSYFEGLKSVGQGTDEIVVSSVNGDGNLVEYIELNGVIIANGKDYTDNKYVRTNYIIVEPNQTYYIKLPTNVLYKGCTVYFYDSNKSYLGHKGGLTSEFTTVANTKFIRIDMKKADDTSNTQGDINNCDFVVSKCRISEYIPHQADKKRLLYYNTETQTWEKPILREWDSIEKHANGKYYYHQRSGEVAFDGSEDWGARNMDNENNTIGFGLYPGLPNYDINSLPPIICDRFACLNANALWAFDEEGTTHAGDYLHIRILKSKLSTQDAEGFKQWLQANNVTVVYQLAEEKVYECTNIDLITYANETNYIVESGAITPKSILKVHSNIANVISVLKKKVNVLESNYVTLFNTITAAFNGLE